MCFSNVDIISNPLQKSQLMQNKGVSGTTTKHQYLKEDWTSTDRNTTSQAPISPLLTKHQPMRKPMLRELWKKQKYRLKPVTLFQFE